MSTLSVPSAASAVPESKPRAGGLWWLYLLFFFSGSSGLMFEVVWVRMLTRVLGSTVYATSTVLAAFMAGLALGSFLIGRFIDRVAQPLRWYALLELGIGLTALTSLVLTDHLQPVYQALYDLAGGSRAWLTAGQVGIALLVLLLPTALMGATLPTLCAYGARRHQAFGKCVGLLYSLNTLGAVVGILASGFVLLGEIGETRTVYLGALLNGGVAVAAWLLGGLEGWLAGGAAQQQSHPPTSDLTNDQPIATYSTSCRRAILAAFALGGFVSLANEVVWSRMLLLHQGTSIYAFSSMLAVVLTGIAIGSLVGGWNVGRWSDPLRQLARVQLAIGVAGLVALHLFPNQKAGFFWAPIILLLPLGLLWGLAFPLGAACYRRAQTGAGRTIAALYTWNTCGCIAGSLGAGFMLIPLLGSSRTVASLAVVSALLGLLLLWVHPHGLRRQVRGLEGGMAVACLVLMLTLKDPYLQRLHRSMQQQFPGQVEILHHSEDAAATTTVFRPEGRDPRYRQLWINGTGMTTLAPVTKMMAHLPLALADDPHDMLVICFGMGTTLRSAALHEGLQIRVVELVPAVISCFGLFHADGPQLLEQPNVRAIADDGRNYLLMHPQQYDVITIDPAPPLYSAGTVNLYTREFFALCRSRLRPGGVMCLWIPPDKQSEVKMIIRTYLDVFEHVQAWAGPAPHRGFLLLGTHEPMPLAKVPEKIRRLYDKPAVAADLRAWDSVLDEPAQMLDLYVADGAQMRQNLAGVSIITDDCPYSEFYLWRSLTRSSEYQKVGEALTYKERVGGDGSTPNPFK